MLIAILEDSVAQAETIVGLLKRAHYDTVMRHDGDSFLELVNNEKVDLLLLDWDVPGTRGIDVLRQVRKTLGDSLPIMMVTHHDSEQDIVYGLNAGADDYLVKPVRERELVARVAAQLRKYYPETQKPERIEVGRYSLDTESRKVFIGDANGAAGQEVSLPGREFDLALLLFSRSGQIVTKDFLCKQIWGVIDRKYDASLATYVSKLRNALALRKKNGLVISTIYNHGYRLERA
ncbi:response regulator transcription factor [Andreprevotia chitinilytica]|uniref:response regulator transcription factor n=1 Tax=Andreprevotia chitinilytica TaxID=396808 RepID=UPI000552E082|nr:response regulator transcription factor [Andreprevotia chitinilytica]